jgi:hypothetical protein
VAVRHMIDYKCLNCHKQTKFGIICCTMAGLTDLECIQKFL